MSFKIGDTVKIVECKYAKEHNIVGKIFKVIECGLTFDLYRAKEVGDSNFTCVLSEDEMVLYEEKVVNRPPLGLVSRKIHEAKRIQELTRVLYEYATYDIANLKIKPMLDWTSELFDLLEQKHIRNILDECNDETED